MKRIILALLATTMAKPALAQHSGHDQPSPPQAQTGANLPPAQPSTPAPPSTPTACTPEHAAMGHCTMSPAVQSPAAPPSVPCPPEHAAMGHCTEAATQQADPHAGHAMPAQQSPGASADPHAGHGMGAQAAHALPPETPPPPAAFSGPENAADLFYPQAAMAAGRQVLVDEHGDIPVHRVLVDQAEVRLRSGRDGYFVNAEAWYGGDIDKLWLKTEIEGDFGETAEQIELQALWSHALDPWFDLQLGVRHDIEPAGRTHLVTGIQGLAPYWFEVDAALFLSDKGDVTARFEAEYDLRLTQRLILQPRVELDFALQDIPEERLGAGLSTLETGVRLRYEISRQFAPYIGVEHDRGIGDTARFRRAIGEDVGGFSFVAGLRAWF